jgi:hypothetical protein
MGIILRNSLVKPNGYIQGRGDIETILSLKFTYWAIVGWLYKAYPERYLFI